MKPGHAPQAVADRLGDPQILGAGLSLRVRPHLQRAECAHLTSDRFCPSDVLGSRHCIGDQAVAAVWPADERSATNAIARPPDARSKWRRERPDGSDQRSDLRLGLGRVGPATLQSGSRSVRSSSPDSSSIPSATQVHLASSWRTVHSSRSARRVAPMLPDLERRQHASSAQVEDSRVAELEQLGDLVRLEDPELRHYVGRGFSGHCKREGTRRGL